MNRILQCVLILFVVGSIGAAEDPPIEHITYEEFLRAVDAGHIREVRFYNVSGLEGTIHRPQGIVRFDSARAFQSSGDPLLLRVLKDKGVKIEQSEESKFRPLRSGFNLWEFAGLVFPMTIALLVIAILQYRTLRRLEKKVINGL